MKRIIHAMLVCFLAGLILFSFAQGAFAGYNYRVKSGDTLYLISRRTGSSITAIKTANKLSGNTIYPNQLLYIPTNEELGWTSPAGGGTYRVQKGDTLYLIAKKYGISVVGLQRENNIWNNLIYPGQTLRIPMANTVSRSSYDRPAYSNKDLDLLARAVYSEGRGEPFEGQVAIAAVVLNRVRSPLFPNSVAGVVYQPGAFTAVTDGQFYLTPNATAYRAAEAALKGWDPSGGALYYYNPAKTTNKWIWSRPVIKRIGQHVFTR